MPQFNWQGWDEGASFLLAQKYDLEDALRYTQKSIDTEERFDNWMTRSQVLAAMNRTPEAEAAKQKAFAIATPLQTHIYARGLQGQKKTDEAYKIFRANFAKNPDYWFTHSGMARVYCAEGKFDDAAREMKIAFDKAPEQNKVFIQAQIKKLEAKQDINP
jgi:tetratricopeptide (TPR) repeat protein